MVREVNAGVLGKGLKLLSVKGGRYDTALVAYSEEKLCRLVSEFGRVCEIKKN